jgi:hypothetical protein
MPQKRVRSPQQRGKRSPTQIKGLWTFGDLIVEEKSHHFLKKNVTVLGQLNVTTSRNEPAQPQQLLSDPSTHLHANEKRSKIFQTAVIERLTRWTA